MIIPHRLLLGPGPSPVAPRIMDAMRAPVLSHLDPEMMRILDDVRARLLRLFQAPDGSLALAVSGTGTSGMEAAVANVTAPGMRAVAVVNGYFGDRLATMLERYGASVTRVEGEWGRAIEQAAVERAMDAAGAAIVSVVHAETSTGVLNPVADIARLAARRDALTIVDAVTSLGAMPVHVGEWAADVCYSCTQKGLGAPSGLAPIVFSPRALARRVQSRSVYLDLALLEAYWVERKYHHTISAPLVYALREALAMIDEEGLERRVDRHHQTHRSFASALAGLGLGLLPPEGERLWTLNAVRVPSGIDEAAVRRGLLDRHGIEIGAGLGPLAGKIWRVGLMGSGSSEESVGRLVGALRAELP